MGFGARVEPFEGPLARVPFQWDPQTEILTGALPGDDGARGFTGSVELEDPNGAVITLDVLNGALRAIEVVVWPRVKQVETLVPPRAKRTAKVRFSSRPSQPGIGVVEVDTSLSARRSSDESVIHLRVAPGRRSEAVAIAENVLLDLDARGEVIGFWLCDVPPFPVGESLL
jgi:hypothetical protein